MKCEKCGSSNLGFTVDLTVTAPIEYLGKLSKKALRSKDIQLQSANWENIRKVCFDCFAVEHINLNHVK